MSDDMAEKSSRAIPCPCGSSMLLKPSRYGRFYGCERWPACDYTHGAHPDGTPLGKPADKATRAARVKAHEAFDRLWKYERGRKRISRQQAYKWMRHALGLSADDAHIGLFDIATCERLIVAAALAERSHPDHAWKRGKDHAKAAGAYQAGIEIRKLKGDA